MAVVTAKLLSACIIALIAISMLQTMVDLFTTNTYIYNSQSLINLIQHCRGFESLYISHIFIGLVLKVVASHGHGGHHYYDKKKFGPGSLKNYQCPSQCTRRCSRTQYHKPCMFFCQKCCMKCLCVPPGYYGNKAVCPCYNNWKTKRGGPKCP
ncbi:hypothetical protein VIGAN_11043200 [Vigna angularis var. angularis]|uniref:Gibberellin-regulated protein n=1 Tax=Vigna angularis var. angularis TaxID=157739 RepID=A0A0S3T7M8_PHAAN|nr:hypothetical protein VIGAN_11043200 [Vigna angularis var. angularis]